MVTRVHQDRLTRYVLHVSPLVDEKRLVAVVKPGDVANPDEVDRYGTVPGKEESGVMSGGEWVVSEW